MKKLLLLLSLFLFACNDTKPDMLLGSWRYYYSNVGKDDGTMDDQLAIIKQMEGTSESYTMRYLQRTLTFTKKDDSTFQGIGNIFILRLNSHTGHLLFYLKPDEFHEFVKLK